VSAALVPWHDVIDGQIAPLLAAVLTRVAVAHEDLAARQAHLRPRTLDHVDQTDDRGSGEGFDGRAEEALGMLQYLRLALVYEDEGASSVAHV
jgi:hypothetical protein